MATLAEVRGELVPDTEENRQLVLAECGFKVPLPTHFDDEGAPAPA